MSVWFTSDTHFNHANVLEYDQRPFANLEEMTETIIAKWNAQVHPGDRIFHLGDFALSWGEKHRLLIDDLLRRLNGNKYLIKGNHDRKEVTRNERWTEVCDYKELKVDLGGVHKQRIIMSHYAMRTWNQMHRGAWMLHGHSHGNLPDIGGKIMDVGVDSNHYSPVHLYEVQQFMMDREIRLEGDHHAAEQSK